MEHAVTLKRHPVANKSSVKLLWDVDGTNNIHTPAGIVRNASVNM